MLVSKLKGIIEGLEVDNILQGFTTIEIIQEVLNEIYADDLLARLYPFPPYITTINNQTLYTWDQLFGAGATSTWRKIRGIYQPGLSSNAFGSSAYNRDIGDYNQEDVNQRVYDFDVVVDNEARTVRFKNNPGATTEKWKVDYWPNAPLVNELSVVPLVSGWELKLMIPGCRSYFEQLDKGPGIQRQLFDAVQVEYRRYVEASKNLKNSTENLGLRIYNSRIKNPSAF